MRAGGQETLLKRHWGRRGGSFERGRTRGGVRRSIHKIHFGGEGVQMSKHAELTVLYLVRKKIINCIIIYIYV